MGFIIAFWIVIAAVVIITIVLRQLEAMRAAWGSVANELTLTLEAPRFGQPKISGTTNGFGVTVEVVGSGDNARTRYEVRYPPQTAAFEIRRESGGQRILKAFGIEDLEIGDQAFDDAFVVKASDPDALRKWLDPGRRGSLLRLLAAHPGIIATEQRLQITTSGVERKPDVIGATVRRMLVTARHLAGRTSTRHLETAAELRKTGDLLAALEELDAAVEEEPEDLDTRLLRAETAMSAGDRGRADADLTAVETVLGADPEVQAMRRTLQRSETAAAPTDASLVDAATMFDELFGESRLSFESDEIFANKYKGRAIRLQGTVRSTRPFDRDLDFGSGPGTKVVASVATIQSDLYGNTAIDAVAAFPSSAPPLERGDEISFSGTLLRVDPMMRNVYIDQAQMDR